jgi:phytoene/squalene synthetase
MGNHIDIMDIKRDSQALNLAYKRCEYVTKLFSKTFYMGTNLLPKHARQQVWAIYAWCRRTGTATTPLVSDIVMY